MAVGRVRVTPRVTSFEHRRGGGARQCGAKLHLILLFTSFFLLTMVIIHASDEEEAEEDDRQTHRPELPPGLLPSSSKAGGASRTRRLFGSCQISSELAPGFPRTEYRLLAVCPSVVRPSLRPSSAVHVWGRLTSSTPQCPG